jgi:2'-5' RNA ligase
VAEVEKERPQSPRVRLFVGLQLPDEVLHGLQEWGRDELSDPALRPIPVESLHVTLAFLGHRPEGDVERTIEVVESCAGPAPSFELLDPVARPSRGRPGLFAVPVRSSGVEEIQTRLQTGLVEEGLYEPEKRSFWPHVTVARVRREGKGSKRPQRVQRPPGGLPDTLRERTFVSIRLALYLSELKPQGARYTPLAQVHLPKSGRQRGE